MAKARGAKRSVRPPSPEVIKAKADKAAAVSAGEDPEAIAIPRAAADPLNPPTREPRKLGRPPRYRPEMCDAAFSAGQQGMGKAEIAFELGVDRDTVKEWVKVHPEFSAAISRATEASLAWWASIGRQGILMGKQFNANAYSLQVRNRFPDDWRDKQEVNATGNIALQVVTGVPRGTDGT